MAALPLALCLLLALIALVTPAVAASPGAGATARAGGAVLAERAALRTPASFAHTLHVPTDYPTIQAAVDAAQPGDLVLIAPGVYHEAVKVKNPGITIRGVDRNSVILDGQSKLPNGFTVQADNVIIENMTAHHYLGNGFFWQYVHGYRGSYLTAYDNGDYGIYAFGAITGEFDHSYASGSPDSGFYIGQCYPCDALITDVKSEWNGLGYSGTNAGGNLIIQNSEWDLNGAGVVPNTLDTEKYPPEHGTTVRNNLVHDNGNPDAPANKSTHPAIGAGIAVPGGDLNYITGNTVWNNADYGILVVGNVDEHLWLASGNVVTGNTVKGSGIADLALGGPTGANNCFSDNTAATTLPPLLEVTHACGSPLALNGGGDMSVTLNLLAVYMNTAGGSYTPRDYRLLPAPPAQANMPDITVGPAPIFTEDFPIDDSPTGALPAAVGKGGSAMLAPFGFTSYSIVQVLLGLYGNWSFFALYAVWLAIACVELSRRDDLSGGRKLGLGALVVGIPVIGAIVYYFTASKLSRGFRLALVVGAPLLLLALTVLLLVVASQTLG
jgi:hypothetical protein